VPQVFDTHKAVG